MLKSTVCGNTTLYSCPRACSEKYKLVFEIFIYCIRHACWEVYPIKAKRIIRFHVPLPSRTLPKPLFYITKTMEYDPHHVHFSTRDMIKPFSTNHRKPHAIFNIFILAHRHQRLKRFFFFLIWRHFIDNFPFFLVYFKAACMWHYIWKSIFMQFLD